MTRLPRLRNFAARLALVGLLALQLHVLMHLLGHDDDDDHGGKPCEICRMVLHQQGLQAVKTVVAVRPLLWTYLEARPQPKGAVHEPVFYCDPRGPPALLNT